MNTLKKGDKIAAGKLRFEFDSIVKVMGQTMIKTTEGNCINPLLVSKIINEEHKVKLSLNAL